MAEKNSSELAAEALSTGISSLDNLLKKLAPGDNVVWQVDHLEDYAYFVSPLVTEALRTGEQVVYLRFADHPPMMEEQPGVAVCHIDPSQGFDSFSTAIHETVESHPSVRYFVFDNLSELVDEWGSDEMLANFFQVTCPYLGELRTIAYFAVSRGRHSDTSVARIRDTTQLLIDVYRYKGSMCVHPLKVLSRYSSQMFLPHLVSDGPWRTVFESDEAAEVSSSADFTLSRDHTDSIAPWDTVYAKLREYRDSEQAMTGSLAETDALKQELTRMLIGSHHEFARLADRYLRVDDLLRIRERMIGSGRIGGKATGMLLARRILASSQGPIEFSSVLEAHDSFFIGSDVFYTFLVENNLFRLRMQMSRNPCPTQEDYAEVEDAFLAGNFPEHILWQFRRMLDYYGQAPIIVRSSSLLEDSFGNAFAGKYRSEFCPNQGDPEVRLAAFQRAVKLVYASALSPDALTYRFRHGLSDRDEQMSVLVQRVSGRPFRHFFFPTIAGVGFSQNPYAWSNRIDPSKGMLRLVFGLGTLAVNRTGRDYPRMVSVSHPDLRPESMSDVRRYSQHEVDLIDLESNRFVTAPVADVLAEEEYPGLEMLVSLQRDGYLIDPSGRVAGEDMEQVVLTFNRLIRQTALVPTLGAMLETLGQAYGQPVDTEFTASFDDQALRVNLLQCRPLRLPGAVERVSAPVDLPPERVLFAAQRVITGGLVENIHYIVYVDPAAYAALHSVVAKRQIGRIVGQLNRSAEIIAGRFILIGPGRWGSSNIELGVSVGYADIHRASVLVEIAHSTSGQTPELSYGTHFFQDLVEDEMVYLPVYPSEPQSRFNAAFLQQAANSLAVILPEAAEFANVVRVIDVEAVTAGSRVSVLADPRRQEALCYLTK